MEISKEQLTQIDNYLMKCKLKYEDVKKELVDHFASVLEVILFSPFIAGNEILS